MATRLRDFVLCSVLLMLFFPPARADENFGSFGDLALAKPAFEEPTSNPLWGPVKTDKISLANLAPGLFVYFNNGPVFGLPGTVTGDFWHETQLTGDWGGLRTNLARHGVFFDLYTISAYQNVTSGGLKTGGTFVQNIQLSLNIDTGRAGLWSGGMFHLTFQGRYGDEPTKTFTVGTYAPQYVGLVLPGPTYSHHFLPSEYFLVQAISKQVNVVAGRISDVFIPDQTLFADSYKYYFANFNLNKNPMTTNAYDPTAWAFLGTYAPSPKLVFGGGVLDPFSRSNNFAKDAFDRVNIFFTAIATYDIMGLPGQFNPSFNYSNQAKIDLDDPYGDSLKPTQIPQAIGSLLGVASSHGLPVRHKNNSAFLIADASQYLYVLDPPSEIPKILQTSYPLRGVGVFGRAGYATEETSTLTYDASVGLFLHGLVPTRPYDSAGVGFYYDGVSSDLKSSIRRLSFGTAKASDETGIEMFYGVALTPAVRVIASYQHIWNPLTAQVAIGQKDADVFLLRTTLNW